MYLRTLPYSWQIKFLAHLIPQCWAQVQISFFGINFAKLVPLKMVYCSLWHVSLPNFMIDLCSLFLKFKFEMKTLKANQFLNFVNFSCYWNEDFPCIGSTQTKESYCTVERLYFGTHVHRSFPIISPAALVYPSLLQEMTWKQKYNSEIWKLILFMKFFGFLKLQNTTVEQ